MPSPQKVVAVAYELGDCLLLTGKNLVFWISCRLCEVLAHGSHIVNSLTMVIFDLLSSHQLLSFFSVFFFCLGSLTHLISQTISDHNGVIAF